MMNHRLLNLTTDYQTLQNWWEDRDMFVIPKGFLTPFGMIAESNDVPVAAAFLFPVLGCKQAMIRYPISDPKASNELRDEALTTILSALQDLAKSMNYEHILVTTNHSGFSKRLESMNYQKNAGNCTHYLGSL